MDPNETLRIVREQLAEFHADSSDYDEVVLVDAVEALDQWLVSGGFLPDAWKPRRTRKTAKTSMYDDVEVAEEGMCRTCGNDAVRGVDGKEYHAIQTEDEDVLIWDTRTDKDHAVAFEAVTPAMLAEEQRAIDAERDFQAGYGRCRNCESQEPLEVLAATGGFCTNECRREFNEKTR